MTKRSNLEKLLKWPKVAQSLFQTWAKTISTWVKMIFQSGAVTIRGKFQSRA